MSVSSDTIYSGLGSGYEKGDGSLGMIRCFACGKENYIPSAHSGICAWCGYDCNEEIAERLREFGNGEPVVVDSEEDEAVTVVSTTHVGSDGDV